MYGVVKGLALRLMRAPTEPPGAPAGGHASVQIFRASPRLLTRNLLVFWAGFGLGWAFIAFLFGLGSLQGEAAPVALSIVFGLLLVPVQFCVYFSVRIDYELRYYIVTDRSLRVRDGAFVVREKTVSYANVQNLRVLQGPVERLFGIWTLRVETAGGGGAEKGPQGQGGGGRRVELAGVEDAHAVRDLILEHLRRGGGGAGLGDADDTDDRAAGGAGAWLAELRQLRDAAAALAAAARAPR